MGSEKYKLETMTIKMTFIDSTLAFAAGIGDLDEIQLLVDLGARDYDTALYEAASEGQLEAMRLLLDLGAQGYDEAMYSAASQGHVEAINMMLALGATDYTNTMLNAAAEGHLDIVRWMWSLGATAYDETLLVAARNDQPDVIRAVLDLGVSIDAGTYDEAIETASSYGYLDVLQLLLPRRATATNTRLTLTSMIDHIRAPESRDLARDAVNAAIRDGVRRSIRTPKYLTTSNPAIAVSVLLRPSAPELLDMAMNLAIQFRLTV